MGVRNRIELSGPAMIHVTANVINRMPVFKNRKVAHTVVDQLQETARFFEVSIVGYVLMPSHLHAILGFPNIELLSKFMQSFKSISSRKIKRLELNEWSKEFFKNNTFQFWMPRFDDSIIVSEKHFIRKLEYIHNNPVKAGLVSNAVDWYYSNASDWLSNSKGAVEITKDFRWQE
jgi:putative transposase